jgi:hypothetical protein
MQFFHLDHIFSSPSEMTLQTRYDSKKTITFKKDLKRMLGREKKNCKCNNQNDQVRESNCVCLSEGEKNDCVNGANTT